MIITIKISDQDYDIYVTEEFYSSTSNYFDWDSILKSMLSPEKYSLYRAACGAVREDINKRKAPIHNEYIRKQAEIRRHRNIQFDALDAEYTSSVAKVVCAIEPAIPASLLNYEA